MAKASKKLLNYTSTVDSTKTAQEIMGILASQGAKSINLDYEQGEVIALWFKITLNEQEIAFRLPCNIEGAERALRRLAPPRYHNKAQAKRTAWRIIKDWVEAQLAIIECGQAELAEVFMPYAVTMSGTSVYQMFKEHSQRLLGDGS